MFVVDIVDQVVCWMLLHHTLFDLTCELLEFMLL